MVRAQLGISKLHPNLEAILFFAIVFAGIILFRVSAGLQPFGIGYAR